ncbi:MAG: RidA family protein [Acidobacteriota bacterium]|nr:RidA family protein [Acidobacteriota bacterium]
MNRRAVSFIAVLVVGVFFVAGGAFSQSTASSTRRIISLPDDNPQLPFSGGILTGNTLYLSGRIGIDAKTGKAPVEIDAEIKLLLDHVSDTLKAAGMTMDDLVYVQVASTDLTLYDKFNAAYRGYFSSKEYPAREFIGVASILRGGHFEVQAIAVKKWSVSMPLYGQSTLANI